MFRKASSYFFRSPSFSESEPFLPELDEIIIPDEDIHVTLPKTSIPQKTALSYELKACINILESAKRTNLPSAINLLEKWKRYQNIIWLFSFLGLLAGGGISAKILWHIYDTSVGPLSRLFDHLKEQLQSLKHQHETLATQFQHERDNISKPVEVYENYWNQLKWIFHPSVFWSPRPEGNITGRAFIYCNNPFSDEPIDDHHFSQACQLIQNTNSTFPVHINDSCHQLFLNVTSLRMEEININQVCDIFNKVAPSHNVIQDLNQQYEPKLNQLKDELDKLNHRINDLDENLNKTELGESVSMVGGALIYLGVLGFAIYQLAKANDEYKEDKNKLHLLENCLKDPSQTSRVINLSTRLNIPLANISIEELIEKFKQTEKELEERQKPKWMALWCFNQINHPETNEPINIVNDVRKLIFKEAGFI